MPVVHHLHGGAREHPQGVDGTQRDPDDGAQSDHPADPLSPRREDVVLIASWSELNDGENQDDLKQTNNFYFIFLINL